MLKRSLSMFPKVAITLRVMDSEAAKSDALAVMREKLALEPDHPLALVQLAKTSPWRRMRSARGSATPLAALGLGLPSGWLELARGVRSGDALALLPLLLRIR